MFEIEKDVPLPELATGGDYSATLRALEPGDSFVVPKERAATIRTTIARLYRDPNNTKQFTTRIMGEEIRTWRVK